MKNERKSENGEYATQMPPHHKFSVQSRKD